MDTQGTDESRVCPACHTMMELRGIPKSWICPNPQCQASWSLFEVMRWQLRGTGYSMENGDKPDTTPVPRNAQPHFDNQSAACFNCSARPTVSWLGYCKACIATDPKLPYCKPAHTHLDMHEDVFQQAMEQWTMRFGFMAIGFVDELLEAAQAIIDSANVLKKRMEELAVRRAHYVQRRNY